MAAPLSPRSSIRNEIVAVREHIERDSQMAHRLSGLVHEMAKTVLNSGEPHASDTVALLNGIRESIKENQPRRISWQPALTALEMNYLHKGGRIDLLAQAVFPQKKQKIEREGYISLLSQMAGLKNPN